MQIAKHRLIPSQQEQSKMDWSFESNRQQMIETTIPNRVQQPLAFSIDDRLSKQHLTQLDLCSKNLKKIDKLPSNIYFNVVLLDNNDLTKVEHLDVLPHLIELSIAHNRLMDIRLVGRLKMLHKLNLSHNSLDSIDVLKNLQHLVMLNISNNHIQTIGALNACHTLQSLDASDNSIHAIEDLSQLKSLKYLSLHRNIIDSLKEISKYWPKSIHTLIISDNEIKDLTEISYLTCFVDLNTLYLHDNPCLYVVDEQHGWHEPFDYRPYVLNWCLAIHNLDGMLTTRKESLKAEWLLSQGKGRSFRPGEHDELVQYLIKVCGTNTDERDDLHLSRIMLQQDLYKQNVEGENVFKTTDTTKDVNETLAKDTQTKLHQSLLVSESEFVQFSPASSTSTINEQMVSEHRKVSLQNSEHQMASPRYIPSMNHSNDQATEHSSSNRYSDYDNRPIKPLDTSILQSKLNQYPVENNVNHDTITVRPKRVAVHTPYNANRYIPKTANNGPTPSTSTHANIRVKPNKITTIPSQNGNKRHTIAAVDETAFNLSDHTDRTTTKTTQKIKHQQQTTSNGHKNVTDDDYDNGEIQMNTTREHDPLSTQRTTTTTTTTTNREDSIEIQRLSASIETMRTSILQAYLDLHERFTKTTELQTSAMASLWQMFESQSQSHQHETQKILEENRLLSQRLKDLEALITAKSRTLYPPIGVNISKRDARSFFLRWSANPLNEHNNIIGYHIYIDDLLRDTVDCQKFEAVVDCIREEGTYRVKLRSYDQYGESEDSNVIMTRFRRQQPETVQLGSNSSEKKMLHRSQSEDIVHSTSQVQIIQAVLRQMQSEDHADQLANDEVSTSLTTDKLPQQQTNSGQSTPSRSPLLAQHNTQILTTPEKYKKSSDEFEQPAATTSPSYPDQTNTTDNNVYRKPPRSASSSPRRHEKVNTDKDSCTTNETTNNNASGSSSTNTATKRSPTRSGFMSRLARSPHRLKQNALLNALPIQPTPSPTEPMSTHQSQTRSIEQISVFHRDINMDSNHQDFLHQQFPQRSNFVNYTTSSLSLPASPRNHNILVHSMEQNSY